MLSPNARNRVRVSCGAGAPTETVNVHDAVARAASVAVQLTDVVPIGKRDDEAGVHVVVTGGVPPEAIGCANVTLTPLAVVALTF
jgi:hypothetical protein